MCSQNTTRGNTSQTDRERNILTTFQGLIGAVSTVIVTVTSEPLWDADLITTLEHSLHARVVGGCDKKYVEGQFVKEIPEIFSYHTPLSKRI
jgi:hypothetical protein